MQSLSTSQFDFELPEELIAQKPVEPRDSSKLLVCESQGRLGDFNAPFSYTHRHFRDLSDYLGANDWLVTNDAKVLPVRLLGARLLDDGKQGGAVEALLLKKLDEREWRAIMHLSAKVKPGLKVLFEPGLVAEVLSTHEERLASEGEVRLKFGGFSLERIALETWLERHGHVPLPPYISRADAPVDKKTYQTVYAAKSGSAAAPTAGFHFTDELLARLDAKGVTRAAVTLHVGIGTFRPIKADSIDQHVMHEETYEISLEFARQYAANKAAGKRLVAVGTTVVRTLESWMKACEEKGVKPGDEGSAGVFTTRAYITPGYKFLAVDDLITNFHLPRSSLLVLVAGAMGLDNAKAAYAEAVSQRYRFFSYGDSMFIRGVKSHA